MGTIYVSCSQALWVPELSASGGESEKILVLFPAEVEYMRDPDGGIREKPEERNDG
jgi:hypothetical protein